MHPVRLRLDNNFPFEGSRQSNKVLSVMVLSLVQSLVLKLVLSLVQSLVLKLVLSLVQSLVLKYSARRLHWPLQQRLLVVSP
jgi:hypothetical protein